MNKVMLLMMMKENKIECLYNNNSIYDDCSKIMEYWWGRYSYFNRKQVQISDIEKMNTSFGSSG